MNEFKTKCIEFALNHIFSHRPSFNDWQAFLEGDEPEFPSNWLVWEPFDDWQTEEIIDLVETMSESLMETFGS